MLLLLKFYYVFFTRIALQIGGFITIGKLATSMATDHGET
jgi:hypothetical protein